MTISRPSSASRTLASCNCTDPPIHDLLNHLQTDHVPPMRQELGHDEFLYRGDALMADLAVVRRAGALGTAQGAP